MRKNITRTIGKISLALMLAAGFTTTGTAQDYVNTPVEISKDKVRVNGQICYSHVVLERQTLFSISKAYNVSVEDIYEYNPSVRENGLKKNSIILIPSAEALKEEVAVKAKEETKVQKSPVLKTNGPTVDKSRESTRKERQISLDSLTKSPMMWYIFTIEIDIIINKL